MRTNTDGHGLTQTLIPKHGGYRRLVSFRLSELIYDVTTRFCDLYIDRFSRTRDQMVQAARSGRQNIAEGSQASATSKKTELKLTSVARASLEELRLDYEDFLRQRELPFLPPGHPALLRLKAMRPRTVREFRAWVAQERRVASVPVRDGPCESLSASCLAANAALALINLCCYLLNRQLDALGKAFVEEGGFTERLYQVRQRQRWRPT